MNRHLCGVLILSLVACAPTAPESLSVVLLPPAGLAGEAQTELASEGLSALLLARLRALPDVKVRVDPRGCDWPGGATHALRISRDLTELSAITGADLQHCGNGRTEQEQWVQPRHEQRDWSALAAWWVGARLGVPRPRPPPGPTVAETDMQPFLVALARIKRRTADDVAEARMTLQAIVRNSPEFALAQAHLATAELLAFEYGLQSLPEALEQADSAIEQALQMDPDLGMAHAARGLYWMNQDRYDLAVAPLARAAALDPGEPVIALWLGNALLYHGNPNEARPWLEQASTLDPGLVSAQTSLGEADCLAGREAACNRFLDDPGRGPMATFVAALLRAQRGEIAQAHDLLDRVPVDVNHGWVQELRGDLCGLDGNSSERCLERQKAPRWIVRSDSAMDMPGGPQLDLWRVDLGLSNWVVQARKNEPMRLRLREELARLQRGGLQLPLVSAIEACLAPIPPTASSDVAHLRPMLTAWGC
ncbi:MAG: hypothetical protein KDI56_16035 [Xanthomonadales bacterium]|nr:hypothetical protein [Xanthomonadales bacterium]